MIANPTEWLVVALLLPTAWQTRVNGREIGALKRGLGLDADAAPAYPVTDGGVIPPDESSGDRDGLLSHLGEYNALTLGVGAGGAAVALGSPAIAGAAVAVALGLRAAPAPKVVQELRREPWYAIGGTGGGYALALYGPDVLAALSGVIA